MFGKRLTRAIGLVLVVGLLSMSISAQNDENWHPLTNGFDAIYLGWHIGGGTIAKSDGAGIWIPGENMRGGTKAAFSGDYGFIMRDWSLVFCALNGGGPGIGGWYPLWYFFEYDGMNGNTPQVFTPPTCLAPGLISTAAGAPLGTPPGSSASVILIGLPTTLGTNFVLGPNEGLLPTVGGGGGTLTLIAAYWIGGQIALPTGCWSYTITGGGASSLATSDDIEGFWLWSQDAYGPQGAQVSANYYGFSVDEVQLWQSRTLVSVFNNGAYYNPPATTGYAFQIQSMSAATTAALAPNGAGAGTYYTVTENQNWGGGPVLFSNGGYDVGQGSLSISLDGNTGYGDSNDWLAGPPILAPQDPAGGSGGGGGALPTLGFYSWDMTDYDGVPGPDGGMRITWVAFNWDQFAGFPSELTADLAPTGGARIPITTNSQFFAPAGDFIQGMTLTLLGLYNHLTIPSSTFPDPEGFTPGPLGVKNTTGISNQLPTQGQVTGACIGLPICLTYGTTGLNSSGQLTYNPAEASISGRKNLYIVQ